MMTQKSSAPLRVGVFDFINSYPLFYPLHAKKVACPCDFVIGSPVEINSLLEKKEIDIGLISSASYIDKRSSYILLSDYAIAAKEKMGTVSLFCTVPKFDFTHTSTFLVPSHSATSTRLLKILIRHYWKSDAHCIETSLSPKELIQQPLPFLLIGDICLQIMRVRSLSSRDLITEWNKATGLGFVFALIATRSDVFCAKSDLVLQFHKSLIDGYAWSKEHKEELLKAAKAKILLPKSTLEEYYKNLDYELLQEHLYGLDHFASFHI